MIHPVPRADAAAVSHRSMTMPDADRITIDPDQCGGRPCIRGMRIRVSDILDMLAGGATPEEILDDDPYLEREDIAAALDDAARQTDHPVLRVA
jgi:uncharacterized protein (DUF433 family)